MDTFQPTLDIEQISPKAPIDAGIKETSSYVDVAKAAIMGETLTGKMVSSLITRAAVSHEFDQEFMPSDEEMEGYEGYRDSLLRSPNKVVFEARKYHIDEMRLNEKIIAEGGPGSGFVTFAAGFADPVMWMLPLGGLAVKMGLGGANLLKGGMRVIAKNTIGQAAVGAIGTAAFETGMQVLSDDRTIEQSMYNITGGAILGGVFGGVTGLFMAKRAAKIGKLATNIEEGFNIPPDHVTPDHERIFMSASSLADDLKNYGANSKIKIESALGAEALKISPGLRMDTSALSTARKYRAIVSDTPFAYEHNSQGIANPTSIESLSGRKFAVELNGTYDTISKAFNEYSGEKFGAKAKRYFLGSEEYNQFNREIGRAIANKGRHSNPIVSKTAQKLIETQKRIGNEAMALDMWGMKSRDIAAIEKKITALKDTGRSIVEEGTQRAQIIDSKIITTRHKIKTIHSDKEARINRQKIEISKLRVLNDRLDRRETLQSKTIENQIKKAKSSDRIKYLNDRLKTLDKKSEASRQGRLNKIYKRNNQIEAIKKRQSLQIEKHENYIKTLYSRKGKIKPRRELYYLEKKLSETKAKTYTVDDFGYRIGGEGYFHNMYDRLKIEANIKTFEKSAIEGFITEHGLDQKSAAEAAVLTREAILGNTDSRTSSGHVVLERGPFKEKTLTIPSKHIEGFMIMNADAFMEKYLKTMTSDIEVFKAFGDLDGKVAIQAMEREAQVMISAAKDEASATFARNELKSAKRDFTAILARTRGMHNLNSSNFFRNDKFLAAIRTAKNISAARLMGRISLSATQDVGQMAMTLGTKNFFGSSVKLLANKKIYKNLKESETWLNACTAYNSSRTASMLDNAIVNGSIGSIERGSKAFADLTYKLSLIHQWDDMMKFVAGYAGMERSLKTIERAVMGKSVSRSASKWMNVAGIDKKYYQKIYDQFQKHGKVEKGIFQPSIHKWDDPVARDVMGGFIQKTQNQAVITPGVSDVPLIFDNEWGGMFLQFKSFGFAAYNKSLMPALQKRDLNVLTSATIMVAVGSLAHIARTKLSGRDLKAEEILAEAVKRSDVVSFLPDAWDVMDDMFGFDEDRNAYHRGLVKTIGGPVVGLMEDAGKAGQGLYKQILGDGMSRYQLRALRRTVPLQNTYGISWLYDYTEDSVADKLGIRDNNRRITRR